MISTHANPLASHKVSRITQSAGIGQNIVPRNIPNGSVLGINYSGMHDTSIALVTPDGEPIFAVSLERITRIKQDGRLPSTLLEGLPWNRISKAAISVTKNFHAAKYSSNSLLPLPFDNLKNHDLSHGPDFYKIINEIPCETIFVPHHMSHAASVYWGSGFKNALCLVYDGGMSNENCFGGLYDASLQHGITSLEEFNALQYANITRIYTAVTAILGFSPLKHEGKITGLAAYGKPNQIFREKLESWMRNPSRLDRLLHWSNVYNGKTPPELIVNQAVANNFREITSNFSREEMAATVQELAEHHILKILQNASERGWIKDNICLAGGLFANVKINQRVAETGFKGLFIAPPMSDDGTALGAAWHAISDQKEFSPKAIKSMYLGPSYKASHTKTAIDKIGIKYKTTTNPAKEIATLIANDAVVAIFQGACEFGPRALGNRSIFANANNSDINATLNKKLSRTEFMPFAPIVRHEDAEACFEISESVRHACEFMTVTVNCKDEIKISCPAVVHIDGTARPQLVSQEINALAYDILSHYYNLTGKRALVNTSFNVHEEPIVCSPEDALRGFFESGLDYLYLEGVGLVDRNDNIEIEIKYLREKIISQNAKIKVDLLAGQGTEPSTNRSYKVFKSNQEPACYLEEGFHSPEFWGAWSSGRYSKVVLPIDLHGESEVEAHISISVKIFDGLIVNAPVLQILVDGKEAGYVLFRSASDKHQEISFYHRTAQSQCQVEFFLSHTRSPAHDGLSEDVRELGFGLCALDVAISSVKVETPNVISQSYSGETL